MIFKEDNRSQTNSIRGIRHFACNAARLFNILNDVASWNQPDSPRITFSDSPKRLVYSFAGEERATATISSWQTEFVELELVIDLSDSDTSRRQQEQFWDAVVASASKRLSSEDLIVASAPGKVNVFFAVGAFLKNGYHEVASLYQALELREQVRVQLSGNFEIQVCGPFSELGISPVPKDTSNLVFKAAASLAGVNSAVRPDLVSFLINKSVPVAGGMAGGSADAAAALVALDELFGTGLEAKLWELAAGLGADVPFALTGGNAIGTGKGEKLSRVDSEAVFHWVVTPSSAGLATPDVYKKLDIMRINEGVDVSNLPTPQVPKELITAVATGDLGTLAELMSNDLERAAVELRPELEDLIDKGRKAGSLRSMVSGSGPTVVHLARNRVHAEQIANRLELAGHKAIPTFTSLYGTRLER